MPHKEVKMHMSWRSFGEGKCPDISIYCAQIEIHASEKTYSIRGIKLICTAMISTYDLRRNTDNVGRWIVGERFMILWLLIFSLRLLEAENCYPDV